MFTSVRVDYRFTNPLDEVDLVIAKKTILATALAHHDKVAKFRPPERYSKMFPRRTIFFRIPIHGYGGVVIGFERTKLSIDDVCWLINDAFEGTSMNLISLFKLPLLGGKMNRNPALHSWLQTFFAAVVVFADAVSRRVQSFNDL